MLSLLRLLRPVAASLGLSIGGPRCFSRLFSARFLSPLPLPLCIALPSRVLEQPTREEKALESSHPEQKGAGTQPAREGAAELTQPRK